MNKGKTIFAQIMSLFNEYEFKKCVDRYKGDRHAIKFNCRDQFMVMSFAQFTDRAGLRDIETTLNLCGDLYRSGNKVMDKIPVEAGAFYLMDKGYVAFEKLYKYFQQKGAYFVTRAKDNMSYEILESRPVDKGSGVLSDETIRLTGYYSIRKYPDTLRLVVYEGFETGKVYRFLTNDFAIEDPLTIAAMYRERWQIELSLRRSCMDFILSLTQSDRSSFRGLTSANFIISRQSSWLFRRRALSSNVCYGNISPDSSEQRKRKTGQILRLVLFSRLHR